MATVYGSFMMMGGYPEDEEFVYETTYMGDGTYVVPQKGWYQFHVIGKGGAGGHGGAARTFSRKSKGGLAIGSGGSSGSTGAYAIHRAMLNTGDTVQIQVHSTGTTATINNRGKTHVVTATAGVDGINGLFTYASVGALYDVAADPVQPRDASGVTSSGGSILNLSGVPGNPSQPRWSPWSEAYQYGAGGLGNCILHELAIYTTKYPVQIYNADTASNEKNLGWSGPGGMAGQASTDKTVEGKPGGIGGIGGVVIEIGIR